MKLQLLDGPFNADWIESPGGSVRVGDSIIVEGHEYEVIEWPDGELNATYLRGDSEYRQPTENA